MKELGICIPIYNNYQFLIKNLANIQKTFAENNKEMPKVFLSDNCSTDELPEKLPSLLKQYPTVTYQRNKENLGIDGNVEKVLSMCTCDYAWLLGSDDTICGSLDQIFEFMDSGVDLIISSGDDYSVKEGKYVDKKYIFENLIYQFTLISKLIFSKEMYSKLRFDHDYLNSYWMHIACIVDYMDNYDISIGYSCKENLKQLNGDNASWVIKYYNLIIINWVDTIMSFKNYTYQSKVKAIGVASQRKRASVGALASLRSKGVFNMKQYKQDYEYIRLFNNHSILITLVCLTPSFILKQMRKVYIAINGNKS